MNTTKGGLVAGPADQRVQNSGASDSYVTRERVGTEDMRFMSGLQSLNIDLFFVGDRLDFSRIEGNGGSESDFAARDDEDIKGFFDSLASVVNPSGTGGGASGVNQGALVVRTPSKMWDYSRFNLSGNDFTDDESDGTVDGLGVGADRSEASIFVALHQSGLLAQHVAHQEIVALVPQSTRRSGVEICEDIRELFCRLVESIAKNTIFYSFVDSSDGKTRYFAFDQFKKVYAKASAFQKEKLQNILCRIVASRFKKLKFEGFCYLDFSNKDYVDFCTKKLALDTDPLELLKENMLEVFAQLSEIPRKLDDRYEIISDGVMGNVFQMIYKDACWKDFFKRVLGIELIKVPGNGLFRFNVEIQDRPLSIHDFIKFLALKRNKTYPFHYLFRRDCASFDESTI